LFGLVKDDKPIGWHSQSAGTISSCIQPVQRALTITKNKSMWCLQVIAKKMQFTPLTVKENAQAQKENAVLKKLHKNDKYSTQLVEDTELLCKDGKMVIPNVLQNPAVC
jgi:hypothetical protein